MHELCGLSGSCIPLHSAGSQRAAALRIEQLTNSAHDALLLLPPQSDAKATCQTAVAFPWLNCGALTELCDKIKNSSEFNERDLISSAIRLLAVATACAEPSSAPSSVSATAAADSKASVSASPSQFKKVEHLFSQLARGFSVNTTLATVTQLAAPGAAKKAQTVYT